MQQFLEKLIEAKESPHTLSDLHFEMAHEYGIVSLKYEDLIPKLANKRKELMEVCKTVSETDRKLELDEIGQQEKILKLRLKSLEKLMASANRRLQMFENEARNIT